MNSPTDELRLMHGASRPVQSAGQGLGLFLTLTRLVELHQTGRLTSFGTMAHLAERRAFLRDLSPVRKERWVVCAKSPFAGQQAVLAYLSRYTHRVAISNCRLLSFDKDGVTLRY